MKITVKPIFRDRNSGYNSFTLHAFYRSPNDNSLQSVVIPILSNINRPIKRIEFYNFVNEFISDFYKNVKEVCDGELKKLILKNEEDRTLINLSKEIRAKIENLKVEFDLEIEDE